MTVTINFVNGTSQQFTNVTNYSNDGNVVRLSYTNPQGQTVMHEWRWALIESVTVVE